MIDAAARRDPDVVHRHPYYLEPDLEHHVARRHRDRDRRTGRCRHRAWRRTSPCAARGHEAQRERSPARSSSMPAQEVGRPIFFSLLLITDQLSCRSFTLARTRRGGCSQPLAYTKTFAMFAAAILSITLVAAVDGGAPAGPLPHRGARTRSARLLMAPLYRPIAVLVRAPSLDSSSVAGRHRAHGGHGAGRSSAWDRSSCRRSTRVPCWSCPRRSPGIAIEEARRALTRAGPHHHGAFPEVAVRAWQGRAAPRPRPIRRSST